MAWDQSDNRITMKSENDLSAAANKYKFVEVSAANQIDVCDGATDISIGVLYNNPAAGAEAMVALGPIVKVQADAAVSAGAMVGTSADGQAVTKSAADDHVYGVALTAASNAGELITVLVQSGKIHA